MGDRMRLFVTGVAAVGVVGATVAMPSAWELFGRDGDRERPRHAVPLSSLKDFDGITIQGPDNVVVSTGSSFAVTVEGDEDVRARLNLHVKDGALMVGRHRGGWGGGVARVRVTMPVLARVWIAGSGDLQAETVAGPEFRVMLAGSGSVHADNLSTRKVALTLRGSGDIALAGRTGDLDVNSFGSGTMELGGLVAQTASIRLVGSGSVDAQATERANLAVTGSGNAHVRGTNVCQVSKTGSGEAECTI